MGGARFKISCWVKIKSIQLEKGPRKRIGEGGVSRRATENVKHSVQKKTVQTKRRKKGGVAILNLDGEQQRRGVGNHVERTSKKRRTTAS